MRLLVQSLDTGRFLVAGGAGGDVEWVHSLREAGGGVVGDAETAHELAAEWAEQGERCTVVDLDRLGTADDYVGAAAGAAATAAPDGNHGEDVW